MNKKITIEDAAIICANKENWIRRSDGLWLKPYHEDFYFLETDEALARLHVLVEKNKVIEYYLNLDRLLVLWENNCKYADDWEPITRAAGIYSTWRESIIKEFFNDPCLGYKEAALIATARNLS